MSPISCILRIWVSRRTFPFIDHSSCRRTCSRREPRSNNSWGIQFDVPVSQFEIFPDWANDLYCLQEEIFPDLTDQCFLKIELLNRFPGSPFLDGNIAASFPEALGSWDEFHIKLSLLEWSAWVRFALAPLSFIIAACFSGAVDTRDVLQSSRFCLFSGDASIFRNSPSSTSESAMLSAESQSECVCDWR